MKKRHRNQILEILKNRFFIRPDGKNMKLASEMVKVAVSSLIKNRGSSPVYPEVAGIPSITEIISKSEVPLKARKDPFCALEGLPSLVQGMVKAGDPFMVKNLIPVPSIPALASYLAVSLYMPNGVTGEDAGQVLLSEVACTAALSKLAGYDAKKSAGVFTFGGTGTNLYAMKIALSKIMPEYGHTGIDRNDVVVVESAPAHYSHKTGANWLGIGQDNCIRVSSNPDQTTNLDELENMCSQLIQKGKIIAGINIAGGTTSNLGIDDAKEVCNIRERLIKKYNLTYAPHIHMDSVLGWVFLNFKSYDFRKNPLNFSDAALKQIEKILNRITTIKYADSFGVDFHKAGYVAYNSSMIIVKDKKDLMRLQRDISIMTPLFHDGEAYNPGKFTLETSRSAANILAAWIALQTFGQEGYQALLGHAIEMGLVFRKEIENNIGAGLYVANQERYGPDVFVRCYQPGVNPRTTYEGEMRDDLVLEKNTGYVTKFAVWLNKNMSTKPNGFAVSRTSAAIYTYTGKPMVALRIYPLSPYITEFTARELVSRLVKSKIEFDHSLNRGRKLR